MVRAVRMLACVIIAVCCLRQEDLSKVLSFETEHPNGKLEGWGGGPPETIFADQKVVRSGHWSVRLERTPNNAQEFSTITRAMPMDFTDTKIELRGWLKTEDASVMVGLWLREDAETGSVVFDNMAGKQLKGIQDWAQYAVSIPVRAEAYPDIHSP
jgi:hypothetical protein